MSEQGEPLLPPPPPHFATATGRRRERGRREQQPERRARRGMSSVRPSAGGSDVGRPRPLLLLPGGEKERIIGGPAAHLRAAEEEEESVGTHFESKQPLRLPLFPPSPRTAPAPTVRPTKGIRPVRRGGQGGKELRCGERRARDSKVARAHEGRGGGELPSSALLLERSRYHRGDAQPTSLSGGGEGEKATERGGAGCGPLSWHSIAMVALFPYPYSASRGEKQQEDVGLSRATQTRFLSGESACKDMVWADGGETAERSDRRELSDSASQH